MKLGRHPATRDERNIKFLSLLPGGLPTPPPQFDVDFDRPEVWPLPMPMFGNDEWGDCVIAGRANFTLRLEKLEQGQDLDITDDEVLAEYWREQGGDASSQPDNGLSVLESLKLWRSEGWTAGGRQYNIHAFAEIDRHKQEQVRTAIWLLHGLMVGVNLYQADMDALDKKRAWETSGERGEILGGHLMYCLGYTRGGLVFLTWGQRQFATWEWVMDRVDEVYGVVDSPDNWLKDSPVNVQALDQLLKEVTT